MRRLLVVFSVLLIISSCEKDKASPALLFVSPDQEYFEVNTSDILQFEISGSSDNSLQHFSITSKVGNDYTGTVVDSSLTTEKFFLSYEYKVPLLSEDNTILLTFILTDEAGNQTKIGKKLNVTNTNNHPVESTGHEFYSTASGNPNAYNFSDGKPLYTKTSSSTEMHVKDGSSSSSTAPFSKKWLSPAGLEFVRFNDFDYANATYNDIKNAFESGNKREFIENLSDADILLTRLPNSDPGEGYMVIKLIYVVDKDGVEYVRYIFNIKK